MGIDKVNAGLYKREKHQILFLIHKPKSAYLTNPMLFEKLAYILLKDFD